jgi:hypothetical protein
MNRRTLRRLVCIATVLTLPALSRAADVLAEVPNGALGFVLVRNLSAVDAKVGQLASLLQRNIPRPLGFLKDFAGISDGLNPDGDFLLALFSSTNGSEQSLVFCVWLPVTDYDRFLSSLGATTIDGVAAATIAGEDLLVAQRGEWALVMDPDQRERIAELAVAEPAPPRLPAWDKWIAANDVTVVAFSPGVRTLVASFAADGAADERSPDANNRDFARRNPNANPRLYYSARRYVTLADMWENAKTEFQKWSAAMPELAGAMRQADIVGCGLRIDGSGNAQASVRVALGKSASTPLFGAGGKGSSELPPSLYTGGGFVSNGAGRVPPAILSAYARGYARYLAAEMKVEERTELDEASLKRLMEAGEKAAGLVHSIHFVSQPGEAAQPIYSNDFMVVRVSSAGAFVEHAKEVMRLWNSANRNAKGDTRLVFDLDDTKIGETPATLYSLDMATLEGGLILPEVRQVMEKLFGPDGKLRLWIVPADEHTVLLAAATPDQMTAALKVLGEKQNIDWNRNGLRECNALLPAESDWRVFVDPHRYLDWQRREQAAIAGVPIIGGTLVRDFPASPPVGIAGGFCDGELWLEAAALAPTVKSADTYLARNRSRAAIQLRARAIAPVPVPAPAPQK